MNQSNEDTLVSILQELRQERDAVDNLIHGNIDKISEIECYLNSLTDTEERDFRIFSPRDAESKFKYDLQKGKTEILLFEKQNNEYISTLNNIESKIKRIENIIFTETECKDKDSDKMAVQNNSVIGKKNVTLTIMNIQEEERQRIARDLHDTSLQNLTHLVHKVELSSLYMDQDILRAKLELAVINKNLKCIIDEIRNTIFNLRPMTFDDLGMKDALERMLIEICEKAEYEVTKEIDDISCVDDLFLVTIYRLVQECLSNAVKHSGGNKIFLSCKNKDKGCEIMIKDNGIGFTMDEVQCKQSKHFGLLVMNERVELLDGTMKIESGQDQGTKITIYVPCISG